jgi:hypothetical protein
VAYSVRPAVNATLLAALIFLAAVPVFSFCLLPVLHAAFKSYKMLSVHKLCQSRSLNEIEEYYRERRGESKVVASEEIPPGV